jgi:hypothetical protein
MASALGACGTPAPDERAAARALPAPEPLGDKYVLLTSDTSVFGVAATSGATNRYDDAVAAPDRAAVVSADTTVTGTVVTATEPTDGTVLWSQAVDGRFGVRVVANGASRAALGPGAFVGTDYAVDGRDRTPIVVVGDGHQQRYDLEGNFEPEAFTADGEGLVVIEYLPPLAPDKYTIRLLDLTNGDLRAVTDPHGEGREPMRGTARTSVMSPDGKRLYTYYAAPDGAVVHGATFPAFVHVLDLEHGWAHCVGLEAPFGGASVGLAVSRDGATVYVVDAFAGALAELDAASIAITRRAEITPVATDVAVTPAASVAVGDETLYVGAGADVRAYDRDSLALDGTWGAPGAVLGLRLDAAERWLFVALAERIVSLDPRQLVVADEHPVPGAVNVRSGDPATRPVDGERDEVKCAC